MAKWTDPTVLVPLIVAAIASIVGPIVVPAVSKWIQSEDSQKNFRDTGNLTQPKRAPNSNVVHNFICTESNSDTCVIADAVDCSVLLIRNFKVQPGDPYNLDRDGDGIGCEE